jgi:hypothetical protein
MIVRPSPVRIPDASPRRQASRPADRRPVDYDEKFDADTLYYDVFRVGDRVLAMGPPLLNLESEVPGWRYAADGDVVNTPHLRPLDRTHRAILRVPPEASTLSVTGSDGRGDTVPIGADLASVFAGRRALMTVQLDNDLEWIRDWARWHVAAQGTDAVVVYDNGSTRYDLEDVLDALCVPGVRVAAVVDWAFIFGPQGGDDTPWDSDFAQYGAIEHARRRLFREAAGVLSIDIDELVYAARDRSVYQCAEESAEGFALFGGTWTYADPDSNVTRPSHADCQWLRPTDADAAIKWCAVPKRLPRRSQLVVHGAHGVAEPRTSPIAYWHMYPVSTHWKVDRSTTGKDSAAFTHSALIASQIEQYLSRGEPQQFHTRRAPDVLASRVRARADQFGLWLRRIAQRRLRRG